MKMKIEIGKDNTEAFLANLENAKKTILFSWGEIGETYAKQICPVDTGRLRASITHQEDENSTQIGTNVEYAPYVELGTSKMKPQPYLRPAVENHIQTYKDAALQAISKF